MYDCSLEEGMRDDEDGRNFCLALQADQGAR